MIYLVVLLLLSIGKCQPTYEYPETAARSNSDGNLKESESHQATGNSLGFDEYNWPKVNSSNESTIQTDLISSSNVAQPEGMNTTFERKNENILWDTVPESHAQQNNLDSMLNQYENISVVTAIHPEYESPSSVEWTQICNQERNEEITTSSVTSDTKDFQERTNDNSLETISNNNNHQQVGLESPSTIVSQEGNNHLNSRFSQWNQNDGIPVVSTINENAWKNPTILEVGSNQNEVGQDLFGGWFYNEGGKYFQTSPVISSPSMNPNDIGSISVNMNSNSLDQNGNQWNTNSVPLNNNNNQLNNNLPTAWNSNLKNVKNSPEIKNPSNADSNSWIPIVNSSISNNNYNNNNNNGWNVNSPSNAATNAWNTQQSQSNDNNNIWNSNIQSAIPVSSNSNSLGQNNGPWDANTNNIQSSIVNNNNQVSNAATNAWNTQQSQSNDNNNIWNSNIQSAIPASSNSNLLGQNNGPWIANTNNIQSSNNNNQRNIPSSSYIYSLDQNNVPWNANANNIQTPSSTLPNSPNPWNTQQVNTPQLPVSKSQVFKHVYIHSAPDDLVNEPAAPKPTVPPPPKQKHYKVIFIKAPSASVAPPPFIPRPPEVDEKTLVYVLSKQQEQPTIEIPTTQAPKAPSKPEVYFIGYKTREDINSQLNAIESNKNLAGSYGAPVTTNTLHWN